MDVHGMTLHESHANKKDDRWHRQAARSYGFNCENGLIATCLFYVSGRAMIDECPQINATAMDTSHNPRVADGRQQPSRKQQPLTHQRRTHFK